MPAARPAVARRPSPTPARQRRRPFRPRTTATSATRTPKNGETSESGMLTTPAMTAPAPPPRSPRPPVASATATPQHELGSRNRPDDQILPVHPASTGASVAARTPVAASSPSSPVGFGTTDASPPTPGPPSLSCWTQRAAAAATAPAATAGRSSAPSTTTSADPDRQPRTSTVTAPRPSSVWRKRLPSSAGGPNCPRHDPTSRVTTREESGKARWSNAVAPLAHGRAGRTPTGSGKGTSTDPPRGRTPRKLPPRHSSTDADRAA